MDKGIQLIKKVKADINDLVDIILSEKNAEVRIELPNGFLGVGRRVRCFVKAKDIPDHFPMERIKGVAGVS